MDRLHASKQFTLLLNLSENTTEYSTGEEIVLHPDKEQGRVRLVTRLASQSSLMEAMIFNHFEEPSNEAGRSGEEGREQRGKESGPSWRGRVGIWR